MILFKAANGVDCYVDEDKIVAIKEYNQQHAHLGEMFQGSKILLEGNVQIVVRSNLEDVVAAIEGRIKWVNLKINSHKVIGVSSCCQGSEIHMEGGSTFVVRGTPSEVWQKLTGR